MLFAGGHMRGFFMNDARTVVAINFVPLTTIVAVVAAFAIGAPAAMCRAP
jgi:hypothetical protein